MYDIEARLEYILNDDKSHLFFLEDKDEGSFNNAKAIDEALMMLDELHECTLNYEPSLEYVDNRRDIFNKLKADLEKKNTPLYQG